MSAMFNAYQRASSMAVHLVTLDTLEGHAPEFRGATTYRTLAEKDAAVMELNKTDLNEAIIKSSILRDAIIRADTLQSYGDHRNAERHYRAADESLHMIAAIMGYRLEKVEAQS